jgi:hypothetical protein
MKTLELTGKALDWAVAKCEGIEARYNTNVMFLEEWSESDSDIRKFICFSDNDEHAIEQCIDASPNCTIILVEAIEPYCPSTDWAVAGPIIDREKIDLISAANSTMWGAHSNVMRRAAYSSIVLVAAMRCYVSCKFGNEIAIPEEFK